MVFSWLVLVGTYDHNTLEIKRRKFKISLVYVETCLKMQVMFSTLGSRFSSSFFPIYYTSQSPTVSISKPITLSSVDMPAGKGQRQKAENIWRNPMPHWWGHIRSCSHPLPLILFCSREAELPWAFVQVSSAEEAARSLSYSGNSSVDLPGDLVCTASLLIRCCHLAAGMGPNQFHLFLSWYLNSL